MKRILSIILCMTMLLCAMPFLTEAEDELPYVDIDEKQNAEPEKPKMAFTDVIEGKWYYNAVKTVWEKGYMAGTSETTFAPNNALTRAMFVTILAAVSGDDLSKYTTDNDTGFTDVVSGKWYVRAIKWALEKGVAAGMGDIFGVNKSLTRAQMAVMIYKFAKNGDETISDSYINKYGDKATIPTWAIEAVKFVSKYEMISGTATIKGAPYFTPNGTATRAQAAVVINKMVATPVNESNPITTLTLNGTPIANYKIVYGVTYEKKLSKNHAGQIAELLKAYIEKATGVKLTVAKDTDTEKGDYEILIGKTNREDDGTVTVDRANLGKKDTGYIAMQGNYLVIASDEEQKGTYYAMYSFLEQCLNYYCYGQGVEFIASKKYVNIEDGTEIIDEPYMNVRTSLQYGTSDNVQREGNSVEFGNMVHTLTAMSKQDYEATDDFHLKYYLSDDPCLTDTAVIDNIIASVKKLLTKEKSCNRIWVCQSDNDYYCKCENCLKVYRTFGKAATYIQIMQYVANAIKDDFPDVKIVSLSYKYTHSNYRTDVSEADYNTFLKSFGDRKYVPTRSLECPDNVVCCLCTDTACSSHAIGDENCKNPSNSSVTFANQVEILNKIYKHIIVWYYVDGDDMNYPCPNLDVIYDNYSYFVNHGIEGMYIQGTTKDYADFAMLRTYVVGRLSWYSQMTKAEYNTMINDFLKAYYGNGWTYIREYLDTMSALMQDGNEWHVWYKAGWKDRISVSQYEENIDYLTSLWDKALSLCDTQAEKDRVLQTKVELDNVKYELTK